MGFNTRKTRSPLHVVVWKHLYAYTLIAFMFITRQIRFSVTKLLIKINPVESMGLSKSQDPRQRPHLSCPFAGAAIKALRENVLKILLNEINCLKTTFIER